MRGLNNTMRREGRTSMDEYSYSPSGERFQLPRKKDYSKEFGRLEGIGRKPAGLGPGDCGGHGSRICRCGHGCCGC